MSRGAPASNKGENARAPRVEESPTAQEPSAPAAQPPAGSAAPSAAEREQAIRNDPLVKKAVEVFGGRVVHVEPRKKES